MAKIHVIVAALAFLASVALVECQDSRIAVRRWDVDDDRMRSGLSRLSDEDFEIIREMLIAFIAHLRSGSWDKALALCSGENMVDSWGYGTTEQYFSQVLPSWLTEGFVFAQLTHWDYIHQDLYHFSFFPYTYHYAYDIKWRCIIGDEGDGYRIAFTSTNYADFIQMIAPRSEANQDEEGPLAQSGAACDAKEYNQEGEDGETEEKNERENGSQEDIPVSGRTFAISDLDMDLVWVDPGRFEMGSNEGMRWEKPVRMVEITRGYWMGRTEVTNAQYVQFVRDSGYKGRSDAGGRYLTHFSGGSSMSTADDHPVVWVSWNNAVAFCQWLTGREGEAGRLPEGYVYRLPTEAEWEYAARGGRHGRDTIYSGSDTLDEVAWYQDNSGGGTQPVGTKAANELGLHDMSGNVFEWVHDIWQDGYDGLETVDPTGPRTGRVVFGAAQRVFRGGSHSSLSSFCRTAIRVDFEAAWTLEGCGFRVVLGPSL